jgi:hypothetical protein
MLGDKGIQTYLSSRGTALHNIWNMLYNSQIYAQMGERVLKYEGVTPVIFLNCADKCATLL